MANEQDSILEFEDPRPFVVAEEDTLHLSIDGFEGPLDLLLMLARAQKVDLTHISILELVEQFLTFIAKLDKHQLEIAADYLVMAAWLAYLKSRLLLPPEEGDEEPTGDEMALRLQLQLQRLEAMREAGASLMSSNRMGRDVFVRGNPEGIIVIKEATYDATLYELLKAYAAQRARTHGGTLKIIRRPIYSLEDALQRLTGLIGTMVDWTVLLEFLPEELKDMASGRSALASMFVATLELARKGDVDIKQLETYGPIYVRRRKAKKGKKIPGEKKAD